MRGICSTRKKGCATTRFSLSRFSRWIGARWLSSRINVRSSGGHRMDGRNGRLFHRMITLAWVRTLPTIGGNTTENACMGQPRCLRCHCICHHSCEAANLRSAHLREILIEWDSTDCRNSMSTTPSMIVAHESDSNHWATALGCGICTSSRWHTLIIDIP